MSTAAPALTEPRERCYRCHKPRVTCLCEHITRVDNETPVVVVQHPRERFHPIGTARIICLSLKRVHVEVAFRGALTEPPAWLLPGAGLLYPAPDAVELGAEGSPRPQQLVVLDGTWHHARTLYRDLPWLERLPHFRLSPDTPSRYRIRREPTRDSISTVEAVATALRRLEPDTPGIGGLLATFDHMIDTQLEHIEERAGARRLKRRRTEDRKGLPRALAERFEHLVVSYAESLRPHPDDPKTTPREMVQLVALRPASGELFECVCRPSAPPNPGHLAHMGLTVEQVDTGASASELAARWRAFARPTDSLAAWNQSTLDALRHAGLAQSGLSLKSVYSAVTRVRAGTLDEVITREGLTPSALPLTGRAARRLASAVAVARRLSAH